jgi:hypothetical protein
MNLVKLPMESRDPLHISAATPSLLDQDDRASAIAQSEPPVA